VSDLCANRRAWFVVRGKITADLLRPTAVAADAHRTTLMVVHTKRQRTIEFATPPQRDGVSCVFSNPKSPHSLANFRGKVSLEYFVDGTIASAQE